MKRLALAALALAIGLEAASAAGGAESQGTGPAQTPGTPKSIRMYLVADTNEITPTVTAEVNRRLLRDMNAKIDFAYIPMADRAQKYTLILASGEPFDVIFTALWQYFREEGSKGAFLPLQDLLPKYAPDLWKNTPKEAWDQATINKNILMVPAVEPGYDTWGFLLRGDLRKKYGIPANFKKYSDLGPYFEAVKKNQPDFIPYNEKAKSPMYYIPMYEWDWSGTFTGDGGEIVYDQRNPRKLFAYTFTKEFEDLARLQRDWYLKGYWSKSILSSNARSRDNLKNGTSAVGTVNPPNLNPYYIEMQKEHPEWELEFYVFEGTERVKITPWTNDGLALSRSTKQAELALKVIEKLRENEEYNRLSRYGIEGTHYVISPKGQIAPAPGYDSTKFPFPAGMPGSNGWKNQKFSLPLEGTWDRYTALIKDLGKMAYSGANDGFNPDFSKIQAETTAVNNVMTQYWIPVLWGILDPDQGIPMLRQKLTEAGIEKVRAELQTQLDAYWAAK